MSLELIPDLQRGVLADVDDWSYSIECSGRRISYHYHGERSDELERLKRAVRVVSDTRSSHYRILTMVSLESFEHDAVRLQRPEAAVVADTDFRDVFADILQHVERRLRRALLEDDLADEHGDLPDRVGDATVDRLFAFYDGDLERLHDAIRNEEIDEVPYVTEPTASILRDALENGGDDA